MGTKRREGKPKKKSIKANVTSKFSSTRRLSRMGKKVRKGKMGPSTEYVTRSQALKKLQISLKDFRRLCILKGIYPRVPSKPLKGADKVYYDIKDLSHLAHEPLLMKFREFKTFMRKIRNAAGRNQPEEARRRNAGKPQFILDHLVKERYPRFIDALRDVDDALCMVHLFAALPSVGRVTASKTATCQDLVRHWQFYVARSKSLRKVFVSVKGVYFQCDVMGEMVTWLSPHTFTQQMPKDVDFRVMITFLDFYEVFLRFVLFKLFSMLGLSYPPKLDPKLHHAGSYLLAIKPTRIDGGDTAEVEENVDEEGQNSMGGNASVSVLSKKKIRNLESKLAELAGDEDEGDADSDVDIARPLSEAFGALHGTENGDDDGIDEADATVFDEGVGSGPGGAADESTHRCENLFKNAIFFVSREVPMELMQVCIVSFGGVVGWDGPDSPYLEEDSRITHQIVDRPTQGAQNSASREYIQPQWVFDSINAQLQLPVHRYRPGAALPPHLSPFVDDEKEGYVPAYKEDIMKLQKSSDVGVTAAVHDGESDQEDGESDSDESDTYERELQAEKAGVSYSSARRGSSPDSDSDICDENDEQEDGDEDEVEADSTLEQVKEFSSASKGQRAIVYEPSVSAVAEEGADEEALAHIMMNKKTKRLYGRMQHGLQKKKDHIDNLKAKRMSLEVVAATATAHESVVNTDTKRGKKRRA